MIFMEKINLVNFGPQTQNMTLTYVEVHVDKISWS